MKAKYKSAALEAIHEAANDMFEIELLSEERMRYFDERCLIKPPAASAASGSARKSAGAGRSSATVYAQGK